MSCKKTTVQSTINLFITGFQNSSLYQLECRTYKRKLSSVRKGKVRNPSLGACNYPVFLHGVFTDRSIFSLNLSRIEIPRNLSDQLQSQAPTNVDMSTWCRHVHVRLHCFILTEACSCRLELAYFAGKISKNRLVCENAVALANYGSCRLLVMGS